MASQLREDGSFLDKPRNRSSVPTVCCRTTSYLKTEAEVRQAEQQGLGQRGGLTQAAAVGPAALCTGDFRPPPRGSRCLCCPCESSRWTLGDTWKTPTAHGLMNKPRSFACPSSTNSNTDRRTTMYRLCCLPLGGRCVQGPGWPTCSAEKITQLTQPSGDRLERAQSSRHGFRSYVMPLVPGLLLWGQQGREGLEAVGTRQSQPVHHNVPLTAGEEAS